MKDNILIDALGSIEDELIADAKTFSAKRLYFKIASAAACLAVIIAVIPAARFFIKNDSNVIPSDNSSKVSSADTSNTTTDASSLPTGSDADVNSKEEPVVSAHIGNKENPNTSMPLEPTIPVYESAFFSANDILGSIRTGAMSGTTSYEKVYVPDIKYLQIDPLPTDLYANIYQRDENKGNLDEGELRNEADKILPKLITALGGIQGEEKFESSTDNYGIRIETEDKISIHASQYSDHYVYSFFAYSTDANPAKSVSLDGEVITVNQKNSNDEILASLSSIKQKLFNVFGVTFSESKVTRKYDNDDQYGVRTITIKYYNEENSDYIELYFDNIKNYEDDIVSEADLYNVRVMYWKYRADKRTVAKARLITVAQAEELLKKGYVFGGYSCPICMSKQESVNFSQYDYVDIEYLCARYEDKTMYFPYYAFYKYIGNSQNGNLTYAKTYVPAIAITDLEEYFSKKHANHEGTSSVAIPSNSYNDETAFETE